MNSTAIVTSTLPRHGAARARSIAAPAFAVAVAALELWLKVPVRPALDSLFDNLLENYGSRFNLIFKGK